MSRIRYDLDKKKVRQEISTLGLYSFEGEFSEAITYLEDELKSLKKDYIKSSKKIFANDFNFGVYADGDKHKLVSFNKFFIEVGVDYENANELQVWGERDILPEEMEALNKKKTTDEAAQKEYKRKQFEALKKEFGE